MFALESRQSLREVYPIEEPISEGKHSDVAERLTRFCLGCMPVIKLHSGIEPLDRLLKNKWVTRLASFGVFSCSYSRYHAVCYADVEHTVKLMQDIACLPVEHCPSEEKAFLLHSLMSHVIAYRPADYFLQNAVTLKLPVWQVGRMRMKDCRFDQEVDLFGGVTFKIFVPCDGVGSAIYLFSGTTPWLCADGAGIGLLDDINPFGPGAGLHMAARWRLAPLLEKHREQFGESSQLIGHSLGAILATALAVDLPHLVVQSISFSPTRPSHPVASRWLSLSQEVEKVPLIHSFVSKFDRHWDIVSYVGAQWIGQVYRVHHSRPADFVQRHIMPSMVMGGGAVRIAPLDIKSANQSFVRRTRLLSILHGLVVLPLAIALLALVLLKRFAVGWNRGGTWRYGFLGAAYHALNRSR